MTLFNTFFEGREVLSNSFKEFANKYKLGLINTLAKENNETDFLSTITEIHFGIFFDEFSSSVRYNKSYDGLTPDWTLDINGQNVIAEVLRLNPSSSDKVKLDFDDNFMNAIHEIQIGCFLSFDYDEKTINRDTIDIQMCKVLVENWLNNKPVINDTILLFDTIEIQLINSRRCWSSSPPPPSLRLMTNDEHHERAIRCWCITHNIGEDWCDDLCEGIPRVTKKH